MTAVMKPEPSGPPGPSGPKAAETPDSARRFSAALTRFDASGAQSRADWLRRMDEICTDDGYFEPLGAAHFAFFVDQGPVLLVSFETLGAIRARKDQMPEALQVALPNGWSHLCLIAEGETWYRDPAVWGYFDRLVDEAFFEDFDRVLFFGAGMGGYGAAAFSVTAPGANVLALAPRATLDPRHAGWDPRHRAARRLDFSGRYGYAPDLAAAAAQITLIADPLEPQDAMHAALFAAAAEKGVVTWLRTPLLGPDPARSLRDMGLMPQILQLAGENRLDTARFARLWRARHQSPDWLDALARQCARRAENPLENATPLR